MVKKGDVVPASHPIVQKKINKSLKLSVREGSISSISSGLGLSYLSPFALLLNATSTQMGILYAITNLLPSLIQLKVANMMQKFSRKKIVLNAVMSRALLWIPILLTGLFFYFGIPYMTWILIILIGLCYAITAIANPAWFSWMGSLVPEKGRGDYFSRRNRAAGFFGIISMITGALILDNAKRIGISQGNVLGFTLLGFGLIFILSFIFKIYSWSLLKKQYKPHITHNKKDYFTFKQFLKKCPSTPFGRFTLFRTIFNIAVGISTPFWVVYMLRDLGFSYVWYMSITVAAVIFQLLFLPLFGKMSDKFGNIKVISICSWLIAIIPPLWILSVFISGELMVKLYLLIVPSIVSGFGWAGYNLAANNYIYDAVSSPKRGYGISYMDLMVGVGAFIGAGIGSLLAWTNVSFINPILFIFGVSTFLRFFVVIFGLKFLKEVRHVKKFSSEFLIGEFQPVQGVVREVHNFEHIVKKIEHYV